MSSKSSAYPQTKYCHVFGCKNKSVGSGTLTLFSVPKDSGRRLEWLKLIDREDLLDKKLSNKTRINVCSVHFDDSAIITSTTRRLKSDAIPTKLLPQKSNSNLRIHSNARNQVISINNPQNEKHLVTTYSHTESQTETYKLKSLSGDKKIEPEIAKPSPSNLHLAQPQVHIIATKDIKVSISTQTDLYEFSDKCTQTSTALSNKTPRKKKLRDEVKNVNCKRRRLEQQILKIQKEIEAKNSSLVCDPEDEVAQRFKKIIDWQNKLKSKYRGNRYDSEYKVFALNLHYAGPCVYRCLQTTLKLPSKSTLIRLKLKIPPKLDDRVLDSLSLKIQSLPANAKYCTICVDEMVLKRNLYYDIKKDEVIGFHNINGTITPEIASNAYVIMLQGIYCNWKQPIAYALLGSTKHYAELDSWMNEVILKLIGVGIEVKAVISDQGSNFDKYTKVIKNVTIDKPYFFVEGHKIFYVFDVPHLLKCVRNNLLSSDFHYKGGKISWDHIRALYEHQKNKNVRLIPKISNAHIDPNNFQRMRVKYAAQIFSNTVSAALETYIDFGIIPEEARATAKFIKTMDDLFDVLNSSQIKSAKRYQTAFRMSAEQKSILLNAQHMFATIISTNRRNGKNNTKQIKTFINFQITIQSILQLYSDIKSDGFQYLFTRRLNQDSLEIFFGSIRQQGGSCSEPTPMQFIRAFSKLFYVNMLKNDRTNCEMDIFELLLKAEDIINKQTLSIPAARPSLVNLNGEVDHHMDLPEENALTYVAGYLLFQCSKKHPDCTETIRTTDSSLLNQNVFSHYKAYNKSKSFYGNLKMPSPEMITYVQKLETAFADTFEHHIHGNPGSQIFTLLNKIPIPTLPCSCFPVDYLLRLFVRLRIYSTLKFNNRNFKSGKKSIKQYLKVKQL